MSVERRDAVLLSTAILALSLAVPAAATEPLACPAAERPDPAALEAFDARVERQRQEVVETFRADHADEIDRFIASHDALETRFEGWLRRLCAKTHPQTLHQKANGAVIGPPRCHHWEPCGNTLQAGDADRW